MYLRTYFENDVTHDGIEYRLNLDYFNVLTVFELMQDKDLTDDQITYTALELLSDDELNEATINYSDAIELLERILTTYVYQTKEIEPELDIMGNPMQTHKPTASYSFIHDGAYIDASFMDAYNMDLFELRGKLPWKRFLALFEGLHKNTIMMQVINIRQMPIPEGDPAQAQAISRLKHMYKLPDEESEVS